MLNRLAEHPSILTCLAQQVMLWAESSQCNFPLFKRVAGQVEVLAGQANFRGSLLCPASNVLEPMLHPDKECLSYSVNLGK